MTKTVTTTKTRRPHTGAELMSIDPDLAAQWLTCNTRNRPKKAHMIAQLRRAIEHGRWQYDGNPIRWHGQPGEGILLDGQNRLEAIVQAQHWNVDCLVAWGLEVSAQDVMDSGNKRTARDQLTIDGYPHARRAASAARLAMMLASSDRVNSFGNDEISGWVDAHPEILDTIDDARQRNFASRGIGLFESVLDFCFYTAYLLDKDAAIEFFTGLSTGQNLAHGSPILALRNRLSGSWGGKLGRDEQLSLVCRAWNLWREGKVANRLPAYNRAGALVACPTMG